MKKKTGFDAIEFKRNAQIEVHDEIIHLNSADEIAHFYRKAAAGPLAEWWSKLASRTETGISSARCAERKTDYKTSKNK